MTPRSACRCARVMRKYGVAYATAEALVSRLPELACDAAMLLSLQVKLYRNLRG